MTGEAGEDTGPNIAWTILYGDVYGDSAEIPVLWKDPHEYYKPYRPSFEDTFEINVVDSTGGGGDGAGHSF